MTWKEGSKWTCEMVTRFMEKAPACRLSVVKHQTLNSGIVGVEVRDLMT